MKLLLHSILLMFSQMFRSRLSLQMENLALRHQLAVYQRTGRKPRVKKTDRLAWGLVSRIWPGWRDALVFVRPETVIKWQRKRFRDYWRRLSNNGRPGRPTLSREVRDLIRKMSSANPTWGAPRILGELRKLGIELSKSTIEKYMVKHQKPTSPTWKAFLKNHVTDLVSMDFFIVPTVRFRILFVLIVLSHDRRRVVHFNVTEHPSSRWTARQMIEAFPWDEAPRYLLRDRDGIYGTEFRRCVKNMGIKEVIIAPRSPWQNAYAERLIGTIRRECLNHVIIFNEKHLIRILTRYFDYYHRWRTHLSLDMDCPETRKVHPPRLGKVIEIPEVGGLHHHYERRAA